MGRHRATARVRHRARRDLRLVYFLIFAVLIIAAGILAVVLEIDIVPVESPQPVFTQVQPLPTTVLPTTTTAPTPVKPKEAWKSCQRTKDSTEEALDCMTEWSLGQLMSCVVNDQEQCPTTAPKRH